MESKVNGPTTCLSDLSYFRPVVLDVGALGFQDNHMKCLQQAYVLGRILCFGAQILDTAVMPPAYEIISTQCHLLCKCCSC